MFSLNFFLLNNPLPRNIWKIILFMPTAPNFKLKCTANKPFFFSNDKKMMTLLRAQAKLNECLKTGTIS